MIAHMFPLFTSGSGPIVLLLFATNLFGLLVLGRRSMALIRVACHVMHDLVHKYRSEYGSVLPAGLIYALYPLAWSLHLHCWPNLAVPVFPFAVNKYPLLPSESKYFEQPCIAVGLSQSSPGADVPLRRPTAKRLPCVVCLRISGTSARCLRICC